MRDVKFRAWDKEGKRMIPSCSSMLSNGVFKLMQYTGLKDINGKEIYEGDIIAHIPEGVLETKMQIIWHDGSFYTAWADGCASHVFNQIFGNHSKVIGNIYENPELLEGVRN